MSSDNLTKKVTATIIIEVLGRPPEHLTLALEKITENIKNEKGTKLLKSKKNEPTELKKQKGFFTAYAEIEVEVEEMIYLAMLMFKYMPAHVEIISPEVTHLTNNSWNEILNELVRRLHGYDEMARVLQAEKGILEQKLREIIASQQAPSQKKEVKKKSAKKKTSKKK